MKLIVLIYDIKSGLEVNSQIIVKKNVFTVNDAVVMVFVLKCFLLQVQWNMYGTK